MKILSIISSILLLSSVMSASSVTEYTVSEMSVVIYVADWNANDINVRIVDTQGNILYRETLAEGAVTRSYNLMRLPLGDYTIVTENDLRIERQNVQITKAGITLIEGSTTSYYKPYISEKGQSVNINYLAQGRPVSILVRDSKGTELYRERAQEVSIARSLDLSSLPSGKYFVTVSDQIQESVYTVEK